MVAGDQRRPVGACRYPGGERGDFGRHERAPGTSPGANLLCFTRRLICRGTWNFFCVEHPVRRTLARRRFQPNSELMVVLHPPGISPLACFISPCPPGRAHSQDAARLEAWRRHLGEGVGPQYADPLQPSARRCRFCSGVYCRQEIDASLPDYRHLCACDGRCSALVSAARDWCC